MRNPTIPQLIAVLALAASAFAAGCAPPIILGGDTAPSLSDSVLAAAPVEAEVVQYPAKGPYPLGKEVLIAAHAGNTGFVIAHPAGDRSPLAEVLVSPDRSQYDVGDVATISVRTGSEPGFVTVFQVDASGYGRVIYPVTPDQANFMQANETRAIRRPDAPGTFTVQPATGAGLLYAVISQDRLDLSAFEERGAWRPNAFHLTAPTADATTARWGGVYWEMKDVAELGTNRPFVSHVVAYNVVSSAAAHATLYAPIPGTVSTTRTNSPGILLGGGSYGRVIAVPCGFVHDLPFYGTNFCAWRNFERQFAQDRLDAGVPLTFGQTTPGARGPAGVAPPRHTDPAAPAKPPVSIAGLFAPVPQSSNAHADNRTSAREAAFAPRPNEPAHLFGLTTIHVAGSTVAVAEPASPSAGRGSSANSGGSTSWSVPAERSAPGGWSAPSDSHSYGGSSSGGSHGGSSGGGWSGGGSAPQSAGPAPQGSAGGVTRETTGPARPPMD